MKLVLGQKIKELRQASDLTQEELANRSNLSKGFISQLENDLTSIQIDSLADILEALGVGLSEFFSDAPDQKVVFGKSERVDVDGMGISSFQLLVPSSTNKTLDPILLQLEPGEKLERRDPHPGEQFGFVMSGTVSVTVGRRTHKVAPKGCFHFESDKPSQIANEGNRPATILWVVSPPQM